MIINPFIAGILTTVFVEMAVLIIAAIIRTNNKKRGE